MNLRRDSRVDAPSRSPSSVGPIPLPYLRAPGQNDGVVLAALQEIVATGIAAALQEIVAPRIAAALREIVATLPSLQNIFVQGLEPSGPFQENIGQFVAARELSGHSNTISVWNGR